MKVLFLQDHLSTGGAARAASRFASGLRKLGVEVAVAAGDATPGAGVIPVTGKPGRGWGRVRQLWQKKETQIRERKVRAELGWQEAIARIQPDLIWVHNIEGATKWGWSLDMVRIALRATPVLWTLHDMWALGDGPSYFAEDEIKGRWRGSPLRALQEGMENEKLRVLTPSIWLRELVRLVGAGPCAAWPNLLDLETFHPGPREKIRREIGLKQDDILLLAAAENLADPRKGTDLLAEAWQIVRDHPKVRLGLIGRNFPERFRADSRVFAFGVVASENRMAELMAAADLFVHSARVESYGLVLEEAQACGTPVMAFAGGGVGETLKNGVTGWLLPFRSSETLAEKLGLILSEGPQLSSMRSDCRKFMEERHSPGVFASNWSKVTAKLGIKEASRG